MTSIHNRATLGNPESGKFLLVESGISGKILIVESGILGFGKRNKAQGIRNPANPYNPFRPAYGVLTLWIL